MNARVKLIRKTLGINQSDFADKLGLVQSAISYMEKPNGTVTEQNIKLICSHFNVNEEWLRTGQGEMFNQMDRDEELTYLLGKILAGKDDFVKQTMLTLAKLGPEEWEFIKNLINKIKDDTQ